MYDHMKPTQRNCQSNVSISHVGTNELTTDMTPEEISKKLITFCKHLNKKTIKLLFQVSFCMVTPKKKKQEQQTSF